ISQVARFNPCVQIATEHNQNYWTFIQAAHNPGPMTKQETTMLSWDEFDKEDGAEAAAKPTSPVVGAAIDKLDDEAAGSVQEARAVSADDSDAVARAKKALNDLDIQEGLDELEGADARVHVGDKQM